MRTLLLGFVLLAATLSGCSDDGENTASASDACPAETHFADAAGVCTAHVEPSLVVEDLNGTVQQYDAVAFRWTLDPGTRGHDNQTVHSMDSRILVATEDGAVGNETGPDDWGTQIAKQQHQDFPASFDATFRWDETGTVYLKGYMLIGGRNIWQDLGTVEVAPVTASGDVETVTITGIGAGGAPAPDAGEVGLTVGDGLVIANDNPFDYEATFACDGLSFDPVTVPADGATDTITFLEPTSCTVTLNTPLGATGGDPGEGSFKVNVNTP